MGLFQDMLTFYHINKCFANTLFLIVGDRSSTLAKARVLRTLVIFMRFRNQVVADSIRHFVNRNY